MLRPSRLDVPLLGGGAVPPVSGRRRLGRSASAQIGTGLTSSVSHPHELQISILIWARAGCSANSSGRPSRETGPDSLHADSKQLTTA
jgi:hypothetical protein